MILLDKLSSLLITASAITANSEFKSGCSLEKLKYELDSKVSDCITYMYFYMMSGDDDALGEKMFSEFKQKYDELDQGQQNYVKNDFKKIIKAQDKNYERCREKGNEIYE